MPISADHFAAHDPAMTAAMRHPETAPPRAQTVVNPVCGMTATLKSDTRTETIGAQSFRLCSGKCQGKFQADPWFYASGNAGKRGKVVMAGVQCTRPMHPKIIRDAPGPCLICGMALEPVLPSNEPSHELIDFTRRIWNSAAAVPLIVLIMGPLVGLPVRDLIGHQVATYAEFALATPIVLWAALPFFWRGWETLVNRFPNMLTLISLGVTAAYPYSLVTTFLPGLFPQADRHIVIPDHQRAAMSLSSVSVITNGLRLRRVDL